MVKLAFVSVSGVVDDPDPWSDEAEYYWPPCHQDNTMPGMVQTGHVQEQRDILIRYSIILQSILLILAVISLCYSWNQLFYYYKTMNNYKEENYFEEVDDDNVIPECVELLRTNSNDPDIVPTDTTDIEMQI